MTYEHKTVLLNEAVDGLNVIPGKKYIDATAGGGGHGMEILKRGGILLAIDQDPEAISYIKERLKDTKKQGFKENKEIFIRRGNFKNLREIAEKTGFDRVSGVLFDLGMSSFQIKQSGRGFSFARDEFLDMRMDPDQDLTAYKLLNKGGREELYEIFTKYGEELNSGAVADAVLRARAIKEIKTTADLIKILENLGTEFKRYEVWARVFQAIRIAVNDELGSLKKGISEATDLLEEKGRISIISFHSLEDRIVKLTLRKKMKLITKKPVTPDYLEIRGNPAARSAKLRVGERI